MPVGRAWTAIAAGIVASSLLLQGCSENSGSATTTTTTTTTWICKDNQIPWPEAGGNITCQDEEEARKEMNEFLNDNMPSWDVYNKAELDEGILPLTLNISLLVRDIYSWAETVPKNIWKNYVLPYANVNEARENWRPLLHEKLSRLVVNDTFHANGTAQAVAVLNDQLWSELRKPQTGIYFKSDQTPFLLDPMSVLTYGFASCTGVSILFVDALRAVGVPARLVGTPMWNGNASEGNHNWVEIYMGPGEGLDGDAWTFIEGKPAQGAHETLTNACDKWFCNTVYFGNKTEVFATEFDQSDLRANTTHFYPMAWDPENKNVPGVNRTELYRKVCQACGNGSAPEQIVVL
jgi:hypothetical protein